MRPKHVVIVLVLLALVVPASPAHAGGVVEVCDEAHLRAALAGGGTVTFTCSGTITLTAEIVIAADTTIDGSGQAVTISGNNSVRVFTVNSGVTLNLNELTVANGSADYGGGVHNDGTLTVRNSTFSSSSAVVGGGTTGAGGGVLNDFGTLTVSNSTFSSNSTNGGGGGIFNYSGIVIVNNSTFFGNSATQNGGGGIANVVDGTLTVSNSTFFGNYTAGGFGGAIENLRILNVSNSTFSGNSASDGGGIANFGPADVSNSTFSDNSAGSGGGIYGDALTLKNTIVANSPTGGNCYGAITDGGGNLSYPDATCPGINADPKLGPLQNNGGPTQTMALLPRSAALNTGNDVTCAAAPVNGLDQRGVARPQGLHCDIGAVEEFCPNFVPPTPVGVEDIVAIATRWGWTNTTPGWDPVYDLNLDNRIDIVDIVIVTRWWGITCS